MGTIKLRPLTRADVTFEVTVEPEEGPPTKADFDDARTVHAIQVRLANGDTRAWCQVVVTAVWGAHRAQAYLGANCLSDKYTEAHAAAEYSLYDDALDTLNADLAKLAGELSPLLEVAP